MNEREDPVLMRNCICYPSQRCAPKGSPDEPAGQYDGRGQLISVEDDQEFPDEDDLPNDGHKSDEEEGKGDAPFHSPYDKEGNSIKQGLGGCANWSRYVTFWHISITHENENRFPPKSGFSPALLSLLAHSPRSPLSLDIHEH